MGSGGYQLRKEDGQTWLAEGTEFMATLLPDLLWTPQIKLLIQTWVVSGLFPILHRNNAQHLTSAHSSGKSLSCEIVKVSIVTLPVVGH